MWEGTTQLIAEELWSTADVEFDNVCENTIILSSLEEKDTKNDPGTSKGFTFPLKVSYVY